MCARLHGIIPLAFASLGHSLEPQLHDDALMFRSLSDSKNPAQVLLA